MHYLDDIVRIIHQNHNDMKTIHNLIIVDASGSMSSKSEEVVGGINLLFDNIRKSKHSEGVINIVTLVDFSSHGDFNILIDNMGIDELKDLAVDNYKTRGMTALYDAIGRSFLQIPTDAHHVFVSIITDGLENDSKEHQRESIKSLIQQKENGGWVVTYLGTTLEAMLEAESLGVKRGNRKQYADSKEGTMEAFRSMAGAKSDYDYALKNNKRVDDLFGK